MEKKKLWNLYGKSYDLTNFLDKHPGGRHILENVKGDRDITPLFESYHAFADIDSIKITLEKYCLGKSEIESKYTYSEFYHVLRDRVKKYFGDEKSVTRKIKIDNNWYLKSFTMLILLIFSLLNFK